jgi:hypothetical protein
MPIIYMPDNTPSRNYGKNSRTEGYAHPAHGTPGVLAKSDTDPRNRGRQRGRTEIEESSRARYADKRERLAKLREEVETKKAADKEAKETKRLRVTADKSAAALANNPEAARREVARQQTAAAAESKRGKPVTRLTAEQQEAGRAANQEANRRAAASRPVDTMHLMSERMKPEGPSLSDTLAASDAAAMPHLVRSIAKSATKYDAPEPAQARDPRARPLETPQPELAAALSSAMKPKKAEPAKQAQPAQTESNRLISNAFAMPGSEIPSSVYSPDRQRQGLFAQQHMLAKDNPAVPSLPNRIADQLGETVSGLATKGLGYFNADEGEQAEARDALAGYKKQRELDALLDPSNLPKDPGSIGADPNPYRFETQSEEMRRKNAAFRKELMRSSRQLGR